MLFSFSGQAKRKFRVHGVSDRVENGGKDRQSRAYVADGQKALPSSEGGSTQGSGTTASGSRPV